MITNQTKRVLSLADIVQYELSPDGSEEKKGWTLFKYPHLNREMVIGLIGLRGEGKSLGGSVIALWDYMVEGMPCFSNMHIKATFKIDDDIAKKYGLKQGGQVTFESEELDKESLLRFDLKYHDAVIFLDEINLEFAESRRSSSNVNLWFDRVGAQLRKRNLSLVYTCIHEMWVDPRIRESLTDVFILCRDRGLSRQSLARERSLGVDFDWTVFPMTRILTGKSYYETRQPLSPRCFHGKPFWGMFDTYEVQAEGKYKYTADITKGQLPVDAGIEKSAQVEREQRDWGWLEPIVTEMLNQPHKYIPVAEIFNRPEVQVHQITKHMLSRQLYALYNIPSRQICRGGRGELVYELPDEVFIK